MTSSPEKTYLRSFGRMKARPLRGERLEAYETLSPRFVLPETSTQDYLTQFCANHKEIVLEIGFGGGEHLSQQASHSPETAFIGCEPFVNGVASLLKHIQDNKQENIRIWQGDARTLLETLPKHCLHRVYILFPDPWPKKRHNQRRIVQKNLLDRLAHVMKPEAELRMATDHIDYAGWMLAHTMAHPAFFWQANRKQDWQQPPDNWIPTRYQQKALAGPITTYLHFTRA